MTNLTHILPSKSSLKRRLKRLTGRGFLFAELAQIGKIRSGNKLSRLARYLLERANIKTILGGNITFMIITTGLLVPTQTSHDEPAETFVLPATPVQIATEVKIRYPVEKTKINQGYSYFHWGIDFGGGIGDPVYPVEKGKVESREFSAFGYGNSIIIDHGDGLKSRYAHLKRVDVRDGDEVDPGAPIGQLGNTGRSTGPHLHLEIYENGKPVNPAIFLGKPSR